MTIKVSRTDKYDFVVCGGGPSGFSAAISAARKGLKVAIIEQMGCLGGVSTSGSINYLLGGRKLDEQTGKHIRVVGGLFDELTDILIANGHAIEPDTIDLEFNPIGWYPRMASGIVFDDIQMKILMDKMCMENGVRIYFNSTVISSEIEEKKIRNIFISNKDGIVRITAKAFADCTGDADLGNLCSCSIKKGRVEDGLTTPASLEMVVEHVNGTELVEYQNKYQSPKLVEIIEDLKSKNIWRFPYEIFVCMQLMEKDVFLINTIRQIGVDGTQEESISQALINGRKENIELFKIMKEYFPGFQNSRIKKISDWIGIRESRRIIGRETVSLENAMNGKKYPDRIAATTYNFDLPDPLKPSYDPMMGDAKRPNAQRKNTVIQIPYGALLPKEIDNLIFAGRCISCEREVLGAARIMGPAFETGQAAGTAAYLAICNGDNNFGTVNINTLQKTLWEDGVLDPETLPFN